MAPSGQMIVKPVSFLGCAPARDDTANRPIVVVSVRLDPNTFSVTNLALSKADAERLSKQLTLALMNLPK